MRTTTLILAGILLLLCNSKVEAQQMQQGLNGEAYAVQRGLNSGMLNSAQASQLDGQIYQVQQQQQLDRAMNGGQLTQGERKQLGNEMHAVNQNIQGSAQSNGFNPQAQGGAFGGHHHHSFNGMMSPYNQSGNQNQYQNQYSYQQQGMPYAGYQNGLGRGQNYGNMPYGQYAQQNNQQQNGLSGAASLLRRLF